jgi:glutamine phosphoribosylpyrophosphate amidotransferase
MCGIVGIIHGNQATNNVAEDIVETLFQLQHRGQDGFGIVTSSGPGTLRYFLKGPGLISDTFSSQGCPDVVTGSLGIGHGKRIKCVSFPASLTRKVRYRTSGGPSTEQVQPISSLGRHVVDLAHVCSFPFYSYGMRADLAIEWTRIVSSTDAPFWFRLIRHPGDAFSLSRYSRRG